MMGKHTMAEAVSTQEKFPLRTVARTLFQILPGLAVLVPVIVETSGIAPTAAGVAGFVSISAAITRTMASPAVNAFITQWAPWLAAEPTHKA